MASRSTAGEDNTQVENVGMSWRTCTTRNVDIKRTKIQSKSVVFSCHFGRADLDKM